MPLPRVILLHGFNVLDRGAGTVAKLRPYFEQAGFRVKQPSYGWVFLLGVRYANGKIASMLAGMIEDGDIIVGHSNGAAIAAEVVDMGAPVSQLVLINPALDADHAFPVNDHLRAVHVWHSPSDAPVFWSKFLPGHAWGDMGARGYEGRTDNRVFSYDKENGFDVSSSEHSDVFKPGKIEFFGPQIVNEVLNRRLAS